MSQFLQPFLLLVSIQMSCVLKGVAMIISRIVAAIFLFLVLSMSNASDKILTKIVISPDTEITFVELPYNKDTDRPTDCGDGFICLVNNQPLWGADGKLPQSKLESISVNIKGTNISLDTSGMFNPMVSQERKSQYKIIYYYGDSWKVRGRFSDGAGAYYAEWLVNKGGAIRIMIGDSELLYDAFDSLFGKK